MASALRDAGHWSLDGAPRRFDAEDWWYRLAFPAPTLAPGEQLWLCFDGLATLADVWLNGELLLSSQGMFAAHERRVDQVVRSENELAIRFHSLDAALAVRRTRPRWRAPMVAHQQLRWFRTTLLGRTPGWSPPAAPVGPWNGVRLERRRGVSVGEVLLGASGDGHLDVQCQAFALDGGALGRVEVTLERDGRSFRAPLSPSGGDGRFSGQLHVPNAELWWPHTHGPAPLYGARLRIEHASGVVEADLGAVGFRSVELRRENEDFALSVNGAAVFCRGANWTPLDPVSLQADSLALGRSFANVIDAGMNMLRVAGPMIYESDAFLDRCDAQGVLLWQDFMFANMDYPGDDPAFAELVALEVRQQLGRVQGRPSLAILCGNSEVEQQAAMWGAGRETWKPGLFHDRLSNLVSRYCPGVPYTPTSAHGGAFPHQVNAGTSSYYGVGAYLRPLDDARRSDVRFASECLAFANVPSAPSCEASSVLRNAKVHSPAWKARTPRDLGAGWDFDDVRDHYMARLFRVDPLELRYADHERYLALSRSATGEAVAAAFNEWRRAQSRTRGALVWFLQDLWDGAGWGLIDASGSPKPAWHYVRRAMAPFGLSLTDEGSSGLAIHLVNDLPQAVDGELEIRLIRDGETLVAHGARPVSVAPRTALELNAVALFDEFHDLNHAYRFGPPSHDLVSVAIKTPDGVTRARAVHFVLGLPNTREPDVGLVAEATTSGNGAYELTVRTRRFAQSVSIEAEGFASRDDWFHLLPGEECRTELRPNVTPGNGATRRELRGVVRALNSRASAPIIVRS